MRKLFILLMIIAPHQVHAGTDMVYHREHGKVVGQPSCAWEWENEANKSQKAYDHWNKRCMKGHGE
jgi:hypothetical protein